MKKIIIVGNGKIGLSTIAAFVQNNSNNIQIVKSKNDCSKKAIIKANISQLKEIGIDDNFEGVECEVLEIDKYTGINPPNSKCKVPVKIHGIDKVFYREYLIPTAWLNFL